MTKILSWCAAGHNLSPLLYHSENLLAFRNSTGPIFDVCAGLRWATQKH